MKGLIVVGSAQVGSHTNALAKYLTGQFDNHDVDVDIFDLAERPLNQLDFSGTTHSTEEIKANTKRVPRQSDGSGFPNFWYAKLSWFIFRHFKKCVRSH